MVTLIPPTSQTNGIRWKKLEVKPSYGMNSGKILLKISTLSHKMKTWSKQQNKLKNLSSRPKTNPYKITSKHGNATIYKQGQKPQLTRLQLENENTEGKIFRWKSNDVETTKPIRTILKVATTDKQDTERMTAADFPTTFSQFKEGSRPINEAKAPEWLDAKVKTREFDI